MRGTRRLSAALAAGVVISGAGASCSAPNGMSDDGGSGGAACASATACPAASPPSYKTDVAPILAQDCIPCHGPSGTAGFDMTTYADVSSEAGAMLSQVTVCAMPPSNGPIMTEAQRTTLTAWLRCGAPDN